MPSSLPRLCDRWSCRRTSSSCSGRRLAKHIMVQFTSAVDAELRQLVTQHGTGQWATIAKEMSGRNGHAIAKRWARLQQTRGNGTVCRFIAEQLAASATARCRREDRRRLREREYEEWFVSTTTPGDGALPAPDDPGRAKRWKAVTQQRKAIEWPNVGRSASGFLQVIRRARIVLTERGSGMR